MKTNLESLGRLRVQGVLLLIGAFLIGALGGAAFDRAFLTRPGPPPPGDGAGLPPRLRAELHLTPPQEEQIHAILEAGRPRTDAVLDQFLPRLRDVADSIRAEIRDVLTPEQQEIFDKRQPPLGPSPMGGPPPFDGSPPRDGRPLRDGPPPRGGPPPPRGGR